MKTFAAAAMCVAAANAWDPEFMRGAQTGFFLSGEDQFEDYSCPAADISPAVQTYIDMARPMQMMMKNMNQGQETPMLDFAFDSIQSFARINALFDEEYDGGEFCKGLLFSKDASKIVFTIGGKLMNRSQPEEVAPVVVDKKATALRSRLH